MDTEESTSSKTYTVLSGGESVFHIAAKVGMKPHDLMEHNGITSYDIREGTVLHLPFALEKPKDKYAYTVYDTPKTFHISRELGARKYAFGDVKSHTDIFAVGSTNPYRKMVQVGAEVVITFSEDRVYSYYLDVVDVPGGKLKNSIGYPKEYLTEGEAPEPPIKHPTMQEVAEVLESVGEPLPADPQMPETDWKDSYNDLPGGPALMRTLFAYDVTALDGKGETKKHFFGKIVIAGTFIKPEIENGVTHFIEYGRPKTSVDNGTWYGIHWNNLEDITPSRSIEDKAGQQYEVTPPDVKRLKVYESALFPVVGKSVATGFNAAQYVKHKIRKVI